MALATAEVKAFRRPLERALANARAWEQLAHVQGNRQQQITRSTHVLQPSWAVSCTGQRASLLHYAVGSLLEPLWQQCI
jgi:hypothetical protein